jgi:hypothetical protein
VAGCCKWDNEPSGNLMTICLTVSFSGRTLFHGLSELSYAVLASSLFGVYIQRLDSLIGCIVRLKLNTDKSYVPG